MGARRERLTEAKQQAAVANRKADEAGARLLTVGLVDIVTHGHSWIWRGVKCVLAENARDEANARADRLQREYNRSRLGWAAAGLALLGGIAAGAASGERATPPGTAP